MPAVLNDAALAEALSRLPEWAGDGAALRRTASLPSFPAAMSVVAQVAEVAEEMDHHPDIDIRWRTLHFTLSTHSAGGVTDLDAALARRIDRIVQDVSAG